MTNLWLPAPPGTLLLGKYLIEEVLGVGGMGVVMRARFVSGNTPVAIKFVKRDGALAATAAARLQREAAAAAQIHHPHVVRVFEWGQLDARTPFFVMELLHGRSLSAELAERGPLPAVEVCYWMAQVCAGLAAAHARAIVHRDLTPNNLFLCSEPDGRRSAKILDFGLAKSLDDDAPGVTTFGQVVLGSPAYMSPEQIRYTGRLDARSDLWALAVVTQQLLTGRLPFSGKNPGDVLARVLSDMPEPIGPEVNLPEPVRRAVALCLRKDPNERLQRVEEFQHALLSSYVPAPATSGPAWPGQSPVLAPGEATLPYAEQQRTPWRKS